METDTRLTHLHEWLKENLGDIDYTLTPVSGDASFRRYFRLTSKNHQYVAVDSPPEKESNEAFMKITHLLEAERIACPTYFLQFFRFWLFSAR